MTTAPMVSLIRAERERQGWGRLKVARLLRQAAGRQNVTLAGEDSVMKAIVRWETKGTVPAEPYRSLLCEIYGKPAAAFGWLDTSTERVLQADLTPAALTLTLAHAERALGHQRAALAAAEEHIADLRTMVDVLSAQLGALTARTAPALTGAAG